MTITRQALEQLVFESGLWTRGSQADNRSFILSPDVYRLGGPDKTELERLGQAIQECFRGLCYLAVKTSDHRLGHNPIWQRLKSAVNMGVPKPLTQLQRLNPHELPEICKVDLMEGSDNQFWIAEIDGYNPRGMGYSTLARRMSDLIAAPDATRLPGVASTLALVLNRRGLTEITLLYARQERFYLPEFRILCEELRRYGVKMNIVSEVETTPRAASELRNLVIFPFLYTNGDLRQTLADGYRSGNIQFLIPPKPFLGAKTMMAIVQNPTGNEEIEAMLVSCIEPAYLSVVRSYLPKTFIVTNAKKPADLRNGWKEALQSEFGRWILKRSVSSGMKGTHFQDDSNFRRMIETASQSDGQFILQEEVTTIARRITYFQPSGEIAQDNWHTRLTVHYIDGMLADLVVTARRDKKVHGAPDCLQLGTILA